jgi:hypothetical protein
MVGLQMNATSPRPRPRPRRPLWLTVMTSAMMVYAGISLVDALSLFRQPRALTAVALADIARASGQVEAAIHLDALSAVIVAGHRRAVRIDTLLAIAVALLTLYAVAAILSRDRRARAVTLAAAWSGLLYQLGSLPFAVGLARQAAGLGAPVLQQFLVQTGRPMPGLPPADVTNALEAAVAAMPVLRASLGLGWSLAMLIFFGGRRGRVLLGTEPPPSASS